jgi:hypothetical protein
MRKKIISIIVAGCFLNAVLYAPVFAYGSYWPRSAVLHPNRPETDGISPFAASMQKLKQADTQTLALQARRSISECLARLDAYDGSTSYAMQRNYMKKALLRINNKIGAMEEAAYQEQVSIQADNATQPFWSNMIELTVCLAALAYVINEYGFDESSPEPAVAYDVYLMSYSLLLILITIDDTQTTMRLIKSFTTLLVYTSLSYFYITALSEQYEDLIGVELIVRLICFPLK